VESVIEDTGQAGRHPEYWKKKHAKAFYAALLLIKIGGVAAQWEVKYVKVTLTGHSKLKGHLCNLKFQIILPGVLEVIQWCHRYCAAMSSLWDLLSTGVKFQSLKYCTFFKGYCWDNF
jgi:hypothetical protein